MRHATANQGLKSTEAVVVIVGAQSAQISSLCISMRSKSNISESSIPAVESGSLVCLMSLPFFAHCDSNCPGSYP